MSQKQAPTQSRRNQPADRRAAAAQIRRKQQAVERRRSLSIFGAVAVVLVAAIGALALTLLNKPKAATGEAQIVPAPVIGTPLKEGKVQQVANKAGLKGVLAWNTAGYPAPGKTTALTLNHDHVNSPVTYAVTPPVGGPHNGIWMNAGVYTKPVPPERAVHDMEHGAVWITYDPSLPKTQVRQLQQFVGNQSLIDESQATQISGQESRYMVMSPWSSNDLPSPVVLSSLGYQLRAKTAGDPRLQQFVDTFRRNPKYTPEYGAGVDGIPVKLGGRPAMDGATKPNPAGGASAGM